MLDENELLRFKDDTGFTYAIVKDEKTWNLYPCYWVIISCDIHILFKRAFINPESALSDLTFRLVKK